MQGTDSLLEGTGNRPQPDRLEGTVRLPKSYPHSHHVD